MSGLIARIRWWLGIRPRQKRSPWGSAAAMAIAEQQALRDRAILARYRARNVVELRRQDVGVGQREQADPFIRDIEAQARAERNRAARPKKKGKRP